MLFSSQKRKIQEELEEFRELISQCVRSACSTLISYAKDGDRDKLIDGLKEVSTLEGKADRLRRSLEVLLYSKSLYPESRGDLLGLLESTDRIANGAEAMITMLKAYHLTIPEEFREKLCELSEVSRRCVDALLEAQEKLFDDFKASIEVIGRVNELESAADQLEHELIDSIFASDSAEGYQKILLKDLVYAVSRLSDRAENVGDRVRIIVAKRGA